MILVDITYACFSEIGISKLRSIENSKEFSTNTLAMGFPIHVLTCFSLYFVLQYMFCILKCSVHERGEISVIIMNINNVTEMHKQFYFLNAHRIFKTHLFLI